jgi:hypothetical protein
MHSSHFHQLLAQARAQELHRAAAARAAFAHARPHRRVRPSADSAVTLRFAFPDDEVALARLAALDSAEPPSAPVLLAEVGGELRAALSLRDGDVVADPFRPTAGLIELLRARGDQLAGTGTVRKRSVLRRIWPALPSWRRVGA